MSEQHNKSASADNAHGGCRKRTLSRVLRKATRSAVILVGKIGEGIVQAVKVWFEPRMAEREV
jgi:hypothetical protein